VVTDCDEAIVLLLQERAKATQMLAELRGTFVLIFLILIFFLGDTDARRITRHTFSPVLICVCVYIYIHVCLVIRRASVSPKKT
jgi:glycerol uptake facilitator-like aquaporin